MFNDMLLNYVKEKVRAIVCPNKKKFNVVL